MDDITVSSIYCDDIRSEIGGKQSFMGVYNAEMMVAEFPISIPKLCVAVTLRLTLAPLENDLAVRLKWEDSTLGEAILSKDELEFQREQIVKGGVTEMKFLQANLVFMFTPIQIAGPGVLRVRVYGGENEFRGNGLRIRLLTDAERSTNGLPQMKTAESQHKV